MGYFVCIYVPKIIIVRHNFAKLLYRLRRVQFFASHGVLCIFQRGKNHHTENLNKEWTTNHTNRIVNFAEVSILWALLYFLLISKWRVITLLFQMNTKSLEINWSFATVYKLRSNDMKWCGLQVWGGSMPPKWGLLCAIKINVTLLNIFENIEIHDWSCKAEACPLSA